MTKKTIRKRMKSTSEEFIESLSPKECQGFQQEYKEFVLSELLLAVMAMDDISIRKLAEMADVSPTIVEAMETANQKIKDKTVKTKFLQTYLEKRLTKKEIIEIEEKAELEVHLLKTTKRASTKNE